MGKNGVADWIALVLQCRRTAFWDHRLYLALGGKGFLLGDGHLNYGRENIFEMSYTIHVWRGVYGAFDLQHINNPGYNRDRGPALVPQYGSISTSDASACWCDLAASYSLHVFQRSSRPFSESAECR
jgi:hypothetical protein